MLAGIALAAGMSVTALVSPAVAAGPPAAGDQAIGQALDQLLRTDNLPGGQAVVTERGRSREISRGAGNLRTGRPFPHQSRIRIGSNTKTFVATVMLRLVAERKVELDVPIERYLPGVVRATAMTAQSSRSGSCCSTPAA
ncbi:hypothetical protein AOZ06_24180 [Kibdelosporangium phytohabitans]|uniref:Beta-lactamase-related domain-containing protein n=1 Tax=Kibdelosporangium phytohabitans TaxID=860235 RepID=A0A0N9HWE3_9PSEU|nr:hypothetical protein AOZ06_24180 [Kibdelosporangium phytohabitans]